MLTDFLGLFNLDPLAQVMMVLVGVIGSLVWVFARGYMQGDRYYGSFLVRLMALCLSVLLLLASDNLILFFFCWCTCNALLVSLMVHKSEWIAAKVSGQLAAKTFLVGAIFLGAAFVILYLISNSFSIQTIIQIELHPTQQLLLHVALFLLLITAMTQSAIWPFHRWLISSLNSPTPVSAIMHAGLINGGGFLLVRFGQLYLMEAHFLSVVFIIGLLTALLGTAWKLIQSDIKRMLACSTMAQMGFMLLQCGLGLFPSAVAHLCWHGLFKATLFLGAGSAIQEKKVSDAKIPNIMTFVLACVSGIAGGYFFSLVSGKEWMIMDTTSILIAIACLISAQFSLNLLEMLGRKYFLLAVLMSIILGSTYGLSVFTITQYLSPLQLSQPQPINIFHLIGLGILIFGWAAMQFKKPFIKFASNERFRQKLYVKLLNASQPHSATITASRNLYKF